MHLPLMILKTIHVSIVLWALHTYKSNTVMVHRNMFFTVSTTVEFSEASMTGKLVWFDMHTLNVFLQVFFLDFFRALWTTDQLNRRSNFQGVIMLIILMSFIVTSRNRLNTEWAPLPAALINLWFKSSIGSRALYVREFSGCLNRNGGYFIRLYREDTYSIIYYWYWVISYFHVVDLDNHPRSGRRCDQLSRYHHL